MGDVKVKEVKKIDPVKIDRFRNIDPLTIAKIQHIAPAAVHIKELNHIDPISVESLRIDEVRNVDPIRVERFDVTNLPTVNLSLRQLPSVDMNIRRLPPVSVGLHQDLSLPSNYTVRARLLGIEFLRVNIDGRTELTPIARARREQSRSHQRSFPEVAVAGNPAIPSQHIETCAETVPPAHRHVAGRVGDSEAFRGSTIHQARGNAPPTGATFQRVPVQFASNEHGALRVGAPRASFPAKGFGSPGTEVESRVSGTGE